MEVADICGAVHGWREGARNFAPRRGAGYRSRASLALAPLSPRRARLAHRARRRLAVYLFRRPRRFEAAAVEPSPLLSGSAARRERLASQSAYHGHMGLAARTLAVQKFGDAVKGPLWKQPQIPPGMQAAGLIDDHVMRLTESGQGAGIVASTVPFHTETGSGEDAPTDLSLEPTVDGFAPVNAPQPLQIGQNVGSGVSLPGAGVGVVPEVASPDARGVLAEDRVFYADASTDTDLIVGALPEGAQLLYQLRSPESPGSFGLDLSVPEGAQVRMAADGSGAVEVIRGAATISRVEAPLATDAQQQNVPVHYDLARDRVTLDVDHAAGDYAYPILVDPVINSQNWHYNPSQGVYGWFYTTPWPDSYFPSTAGSWGNGLYSVLGASRWYGSGTYGAWVYPLYGTSFVYAMDFGLQHQQTNSPAQAVCMTIGMVTNTGAWDSSQYWIGRGGNAGRGARTRCHTFSDHLPDGGTTVCLLSNCAAPTSHATNWADFEQWTYGDAVRDGWNISHVGETVAYITDSEKPSVTGGAFTNVVASGESFAYAASDPGLGVYSVSFDSPGNPGWNRAQTRTGNCSGTSWSRCPASINGTVGYGNLPSGEQTIRMTVADAGGKTSSRTWTAHVYPTSVQYGGSDRSINTSDERNSAYNDLSQRDEAGRADFWEGIAPADFASFEAFVNSFDPASMDGVLGAEESEIDPDPDGDPLDPVGYSLDQPLSWDGDGAGASGRLEGIKQVVDRPHIATDLPLAVASHGCYRYYGDHTDVTATVQVWLWQRWYPHVWIRVGYRRMEGVRPGCGRGRRATARANCVRYPGRTYTYYSSVDVDINGAVDPAGRTRSRAIEHNCSALGRG